MNGLERRNAAIVRRYSAGEGLARIGASLGLTRERVRQIVKDSGAVMPWEYKCAVKDCTRSPRAPRRYCFAHQLRLERYGDPLGTRTRRRDQHGTVACYADGGCRCALCRGAEADRRREYEHRLRPEMRRNSPAAASRVPMGAGQRPGGRSGNVRPDRQGFEWLARPSPSA